MANSASSTIWSLELYDTKFTYVFSFLSLFLLLSVYAGIYFQNETNTTLC